MPKVPVYNQSVPLRDVNIPNVSQANNPPPAVFGIDYYQKIGQEIGKQVSNIGGIVMDHAIEMKKEESRQAVIQNNLKFSTELQNLFNSTDVDENGTPKGLLNRKYGAAKNTTIEYDQSFKKLADAYMGNMTSPYQKQLFSEQLASHYEAGRNRVIAHEAQQLDESNKINLQSSIESASNEAAGISDPKVLADKIISTQNLLTPSIIHAFPGIPTEQENVKKNIAGAMVKSSVNGIIDTDPAMAMKITQASKPYIPENDFAEITRTVEGKLLSVEQEKWWTKLNTPSNKNADGSYNEAAMRKAVFDDPSIPPQRKESIFNYVRGNASFAEQETKKARSVSDYNWMNDIFQMKANGVSYAEAAKTASTGYDPTNRAKRAEIVHEIYVNKSQTDPSVYLALWKGVQDGQVVDADLLRAVKSGQLASNDYVSLTKELYTKNFGGDMSDVKMAWKKVEMMAEGKYGNQSQKVEGIGSNVKLKDAFLWQMHMNSAGKKPAEIVQMANEALKDVDVPGSFFDQPRWKVEVKTSAQYADIIQKYGEPAVTQAVNALRSAGYSVNPKNVQDALDKAKANAKR